MGTTFATTASGDLNEPYGLSFDSSGNLYVANSGDGTIEKFTSQGTGSTFASGLATPAGIAFGPLLAPAVAQGVDIVLINGDSLTVSGAGTTGVYRGQPVTSPMAQMSSYTDDGVYNASGDAAAVETDGNSTFTLSTGGSINDAHGYYGLYAAGSGQITLSGGTITATSNYSRGGIYAPGSSSITVSSGSITVGDGVYAIYSTGGGEPFLSRAAPSRAATLERPALSPTMQLRSPSAAARSALATTAPATAWGRITAVR